MTISMMRARAHGEAEGRAEYSRRAADAARGVARPDGDWPPELAAEIYGQMVGTIALARTAGVPEGEWDDVADEWGDAFYLGYMDARAEGEFEELAKNLVSWGEISRCDGGARLRVLAEVTDDPDDEAMDLLRAALPPGWRAEWTGDSVTDGRGDTYLDINIMRERKVR